MKLLKNGPLTDALTDAGRIGSDLAGGCLGWSSPIGTYGSWVARRVTVDAAREWKKLFRATDARAEVPRAGEWLVLWFGGRSERDPTVATVISAAEAVVLSLVEGAMRPDGFARVCRYPERYLADCASPSEIAIARAALASERSAAASNGAAAVKAPAPAPAVAPAPARMSLAELAREFALAMTDAIAADRGASRGRLEATPRGREAERTSARLTPSGGRTSASAPPDASSAAEAALAAVRGYRPRGPVAAAPPAPPAAVKRAAEVRGVAEEKRRRRVATELAEGVAAARNGTPERPRRGRAPTPPPPPPPRRKAPARKAPARR